MSTLSSDAKLALDDQKGQTLQARSTAAIRHLRDSLRLPLDMSDAAILMTALAEVVAEATGYHPDPGLADAVRQRYRELHALRSTRKPAGANKQTLPPLVPLKRADDEYATRVRVDPWAPPDPAAIIRVYGKDQLARALQDYMLDSLKQTAAKIEQRHPGTKPASRARKDAVIAYIVKYAS